MKVILVFVCIQSVEVVRAESVAMRIEVAETQLASAITFEQSCFMTDLFEKVFECPYDSRSYWSICDDAVMA